MPRRDSLLPVGLGQQQMAPAEIDLCDGCLGAGNLERNGRFFPCPLCDGDGRFRPNLCPNCVGTKILDPALDRLEERPCYTCRATGIERKPPQGPRITIAIGGGMALMAGYFSLDPALSLGKLGIFVALVGGGVALVGAALDIRNRWKRRG